MRSTPFRMKLLAGLSVLLAACGSVNKALVFPPVADLTAPAKPQLDPAAIDSAQALAEHDSAVEAWGDGMALQIGRLCSWAKALGAKDLKCER